MKLHFLFKAMDNTGYTHQAHMAKKNHVPAMNHNFQKVQNPKPEISTSQKKWSLHGFVGRKEKVLR